MKINNTFKILKRIITNKELNKIRKKINNDRISFLIVLISILFVMGILFGLLNNFLVVDRTAINFTKLNNQKKIKYQVGYKNEHDYRGFCRDIEYIGGFSKYVRDIRLENIDDFDNIKEEYKYITLYRDKNTNEILKGDLDDDYVVAGLVKSGINKVYVPNVRMTKQGFKEYILKWTGGIVNNDYEGTFSKNYGVEYNNYIYNMPIDYIVDANWNKNTEYTKQEVISISTISEVTNKTYNYLSGKLSNKEYILNILRNCFGYISDNFYDLVNGENRFYQIVNDRRVKEEEVLPTKICIGDIGIHSENKEEYIGICIGYDKKKNPIFSICIGLDIIQKYLKKVPIKYEELNIKGFNILYVDDNNFFDRYYKTNLPFIDEENSDYSDNKDLIIKDVNEYNNQVLRISHGNSGDIVYNERIDRIKLREKTADEIRKKYGIDLYRYYNLDFYEIDDIYNINTREYNEYIYGKNNVNDLKIKRKKSPEEIYKERVEEDKKYFIDKLNEKYNDIKDMTISEIIVYLEKNGILLNDFGYKVLEEYYIEYIKD